MEIIKNKNGQKRYREKVYFQGVEYKSKCFLKKSEAATWKVLKKAFLLGCSEEDKERENISFGNFCDDYLKNICLTCKRRTFDTYKTKIENHLAPLLGHLKLKDISYSHGQQLIESMSLKNHRMSGINQVLGILKRIMSEAVRHNHVSKNPMLNTRNLKIGEQQPTYLNKNQIKTLLRASQNTDLYLPILISLNTGLRLSEVLGLKWSNVDLKRKRILVSSIRDRYGFHETTKSGKNRVVPITSDLNEHKKIREKCSLPSSFTFHTLRHTYASHFMMNGGGIYDLKKILGHSDIKTTERYAHLSERHIIKALDMSLSYRSRQHCTETHP